MTDLFRLLYYKLSTLVDKESFFQSFMVISEMVDKFEVHWRVQLKVFKS